MIFDAQNFLCEDQDGTDIEIASVASTNVIDMEIAGDAVDSLRALLQITTACTSSGSATVQFKLQSDTDSGFATNLKTHLDSGAVAVADLVKGYKPWGAGTRQPGGLQRYVRGYWTVATASLSAGAWTCALTPSQQNNDL